MFNEGNQIHNFMSSSGSGTIINYGSGSEFLTSYGSGSSSTSQKVTVPTVPVPVPQHCLKGTFTSFFKDKKSTRSHKTVGYEGFSYYFCLMIDESGSESVPLTKIRIQEAQKHTDPTNPDLQH
jgi:hypothetical protein